MKTQFELFPDFFGKLCYYMVIIAPSEDVVNDVTKQKKDLRKRIGNFDGEFSKAHISIGEFAAYDNQISAAINKYKNKLKNFEAFYIDLQNYNSFDSSRTICIDIADTGPTKKNHQYADGEKGECISHLTIAKNLDQETFLSVKPFFLNLNYRSSFFCDKITLLRKPYGDKSWEKFMDIPLA